MACCSSHNPDPSEFAVSVAFGYTKVLDRVLTFLERTSSSTLSPVLALSVTLPVLAGYLVVVTLAFAARVAADVYAQIVVVSRDYGDDRILPESVKVVPPPETVLRWVVKLAVYPSVLLGCVCVALLLAVVALFHQFPLGAETK